MKNWTRSAPLALVAMSILLAGPGPDAAKAAKGKAAAPKAVRGAAPARWVYPPGNSPIVADVGGRPITRAMIEQKYYQMSPQEQPPADSNGTRMLLDLMVKKAQMNWLVHDRGYTQLTPGEDSAYDDYRRRELRNILHAEIASRAGKVTRDEVRAFWESR